MERGTDTPGSEFSELVARAVGAVWPLCARGSDFTLAEEEAALAPLEEPVRLLATLILGPCAIRGVEATLDHAVARLNGLAAGSHALTDALAGGYRDAASLDRLWLDIERSHGDRRLVGAAVLAMTGVLPLGIDQVDALKRLSEPETAALVAFAVGRAARLGDPGARALARDLLSRGQPPGALELAVVKGLGDGLASLGLALLTRWARRAVLDVPIWGQALRGAIALVANLGLDSEAGLGQATDVALATVETSLDALAFLAQLPVGAMHRSLAAGATRIADRPPAVRAAIFATWFRAETEIPDELLEHLPEERAAAVILTVIERLQASPELISADLRQHLGRAWADHPDVAVQRALVAAGSHFKARSPSGGEPQDPSAEVVVLPASALARDDLDRLRVALWAGDSDHLVDLATHVPLDRRAAAREAMLGALEVPNAALRRAIVEAVGRIGSHADGGRLLDAARRYRALESTVAAALRELNARALAERLAELYRRRLKWADDDAVDDYCAIAGPEQVMHLLGALETRYYPSARAGAARAIARRRAHEVVFALRSAGLTDTQEASRMAALGALHELTGTAPSADELAGHALLYRPTEELPEAIERAREAGAVALAGIRRTLARGSWKRRRAACDVLATMPGGANDEATLVLVEVLSDADEDVRLAAMEALSQRGWEARTPRDKTLVALAGRRARDLLARPQDLDPPTLVAALRLGGHVYRSEVLDVLAKLPGFVPSAEDAGLMAAARLDVGRAVAARGGLEAVLRAVDHTWQAVPHRARFVRGLAEVPLDRLAAELQAHEWGWRAREAACQAMNRATMPPEDEVEPAIQVLQRQLGEEDDDVRKTAFQALAWLGTPGAAEAVATGFMSPFQEDRDIVASALAAFGEDGLVVIDRLMREPWWESRQGAAMTLALWRESSRAAVDRLIVLAVDAEYRVSQAARDGLARHGLIPSRAAIVEAIGEAQSLTVEGLEPWFLLQLQHASPEVALRLDQLVEETPPDLLPQRIGLIATFRVEHLALWLEDAAHGRSTRHIGVRLAAADALRALTLRACSVCRGERTVRCPGCNGAGDGPCPACSGRGVILVACPDPDCTARLATRRIDSKRCPTCRGRGEVPRPCACQAGGNGGVYGGEVRRVIDGESLGAERRGRVPCEVCAGLGRLACQACDGSGEARPTARVEPPREA